MITTTTPICLEGVAAVVSQNIVPVEEYCSGLASPKKLRKIIAGTGFEKLSIADPDVCCSDMCFQAAEHLFNEGGFSKADVGAIIFVSQSQDYRNPATAYILQKRLGLNSDLIAFDITLGCSGFVYGLYVAASILSGLDKKVLLCVGDVWLWRHKKPTSTSGAVLNGDAGACAVISKKPSEEKLMFNIKSYGERWKALYSEDGGSRFIKNHAADKFAAIEDAVSFMDGMGIMDFTLNEVVDNINELLTAARINRADIGAYLFHQPQKLLINDMADKLQLNPNSVIFNSQHIGNTSSASIPLLLTEIGSAWKVRDNKKVLMSGFGVGLSIASTVMDLNDLICLETKHYERRDV